MKNDFDVRALYQERINSLIARQNVLTRNSNRLSNLRLFVFIVFTLAAGLLGWYVDTTYAFLSFGIGAAIFIGLVVRHEKTISEIRRAGRLAEVNRTALARIDGGWRKFADTGNEFADPNHPYTTDLDIFGQGSVFQWINAAGTFKGRERVAAALSKERFDVAGAEANQEAIEELSPLLDWRQNLVAQSIDSDTRRNDPEPILAWMEDEKFLFESQAKRVLYRLFPLFAPLAGTLTLAFTGSWFVFGLWIPLNLTVWLIHFRTIHRVLSRFERHEKTIALYAGLLALIEQRSFESKKTRSLRGTLFPANGLHASRAIKKLESGTAMSQSGGTTMLGAILNALLLWDVQTTILLETWKRNHGRSLRPWLDAIAEIELLSSLSTLRHDKADWGFAEFTSDDTLFSAKQLAHPLIDANKRICNDVALGKPGSVAIITGSNMSGKTTLLRTIGVNTILAFAGAPVCARQLVCKTDRLLTSMRITDDLQNGISTFYAELLRIKSIIDAVQDHPSIVLIDEIFRGTNTRDRHQAALCVLGRLTDLGAVTAISTHDLELADLQNQTPERYANFHFDERYDERGILFDYVLRPGRSTTSNAMRLLEITGIVPGKKSN